MALALARTLVEQAAYDPDRARAAYIDWLNSHPFDCGNTVLSGLSGQPQFQSQANGAMMRISPLGIFGATRELKQVARWAEQDAALTHPHPVCTQANTLFAMAIAHVIRTGVSSTALYSEIVTWARNMHVSPVLSQVISNAALEAPNDYVSQQGWVLIAFQNALFQLLSAGSLEEGVVDTVMRGGDTDTNSAIAGALLGAVYGRDAVPKQWVAALLRCRPQAGDPNVIHARPRCYWPVDALELAEELLHTPLK